jgi:NADH-quinone oxidoreductase subunit L
MRVAMGLLALGSIGAGLLQIPHTDFVIDDFLHPSFGDSSLYATHGRDWLLYTGLGLGTALGLGGIGLAYRLWVAAPGSAERLGLRVPALSALLTRAWYFDELIDALVVAPAAAVGRFARDVFDRRVIDDTLIGGTTAIVRAGSAAVRAAQSGFVRYYAALLVLGITGVGFYFLLQS